MKGHLFTNVLSVHSYCSANNVTNSTQVETHSEPTATVLALDFLLLYKEKRRGCLNHNFPFPPVILKFWKVLLYFQLYMLWTAFLNSLQRLPHNLMKAILEGLASLIGIVISA